jgi:hypothetical protein
MKCLKPATMSLAPFYSLGPCFGKQPAVLRIGGGIAPVRWSCNAENAVKQGMWMVTRKSARQEPDIATPSGGNQK